MHEHSCVRVRTVPEGLLQSKSEKASVPHKLTRCIFSTPRHFLCFSNSHCKHGLVALGKDNTDAPNLCLTPSGTAGLKRSSSSYANCSKVDFQFIYLAPRPAAQRCFERGPSESHGQLAEVDLAIGGGGGNDGLPRMEGSFVHRACGDQKRFE